MVHNLPMILLTLRLWGLMLLCVLTTLSAQGQPDHDGHEAGDTLALTRVTMVTVATVELLGLADHNDLVAPTSPTLIQKQRQSLAGARGSQSGSAHG
jgi:hypothetical protein